MSDEQTHLRFLVNVNRVQLGNSVKTIVGRYC